MNEEKKKWYPYMKLWWTDTIEVYLEVLDLQKISITEFLIENLEEKKATSLKVVFKGRNPDMERRVCNALRKFFRVERSIKTVVMDERFNPIFQGSKYRRLSPHEFLEDDSKISDVEFIKADMPDIVNTMQLKCITTVFVKDDVMSGHPSNIKSMTQDRTTRLTLYLVDMDLQEVSVCRLIEKAPGKNNVLGLNDVRVDKGYGIITNSLRQSSFVKLIMFNMKWTARYISTIVSHVVFVPNITNLHIDNSCICGMQVMDIVVSLRACTHLKVLSLSHIKWVQIPSYINLYQELVRCAPFFEIKEHTFDHLYSSDITGLSTSNLNEGWQRLELTPSLGLAPPSPPPSKYNVKRVRRS